MNSGIFNLIVENKFIPAIIFTSLIQNSNRIFLFFFGKYIYYLTHNYREKINYIRLNYMQKLRIFIKFTATTN